MELPGGEGVSVLVVHGIRLDGDGGQVARRQQALSHRGLVLAAIWEPPGTHIRQTQTVFSLLGRYV